MKPSIANCSSSIPLLVALLAASACTTAQTDAGEPEPALTYYRDVQPVIAAHCGGCHVDGGSAPFGLATFDELTAMAPTVKIAIESGSMPPWQADPECRSFQNERWMSESDKVLVLDWIDSGMAQGDPADAQPIEPPDLDLDEVSVVARSAEPYTPDASIPDDYHCLVMDVDFTEPTFLSAYQVAPDPSGIVHHIIFYLVPPSGAESMLAADAATQESGYDCFGSSGHGGQPMGVWTPGGLPMRFPANSAFVIEPGSKIVAQMHYNTLAAAPAPDQTELHLAYLAAEPELRVTMPILSGFFDIPAGDPAYRAEFTYEITDEQPKQIFSVMPHMHLLGTNIDLYRERDGEQTCLVRIDDWDFHWQQFYDLQQTEFVEVRAGDVLRYACTWDNSSQDQMVEFGEGTLDEMCLHVVAMVEPYVEAAPASMCEGFTECFEQSCEPSDGVCFFGCGAQSTDDCGGCLLQGFSACAQSLCPSEMAAVIACLGANCGADLGDVAAIQACLANECAAEFDAEWACMGPQVLAGACNSDLGPCGIEY